MLQIDIEHLKTRAFQFYRFPAALILFAGFLLFLFGRYMLGLKNKDIKTASALITPAISPTAGIFWVAIGVALILKYLL